MKTSFKTAGFLVLLIFMVLIASSYTVRTAGNKMKNAAEVLYSDPLPAEIQQMVDASCIKCHGEGGKALAMTKLNFSQWNDYDKEKQVKKAEAICNILSKGKMPPKSYLKDHPDDTPTKEQIEATCKWAKESI